jgi:ribonuclease HI
LEELLAINLSLDLPYKLNESPPEEMIFCDSSSVIKTITSTNPGNNEILHHIRETIASLSSSGTRTSLTWIPCHVSIEGNEEADRLAQCECTNPSGTKADYPLSP